MDTCSGVKKQSGNITQWKCQLGITPFPIWWGSLAKLAKVIGLLIYCHRYGTKPNMLTM